MKLVVINIEYNKEVAENEKDDIITITCPFKKFFVSINRHDIDNFTLADMIEEHEFERFSRNNIVDCFSVPFKFTTKIEDSDYNILFQDMLAYPEEKRESDLVNLFATIRTKIHEVYHNVEEYNKYINSIDYDGSMDECLYCEFRHDNDYCMKFNKISPQKACPYYKFKRKKI